MTTEPNAISMDAVSTILTRRANITSNLPGLERYGRIAASSLSQLLEHYLRAPAYSILFATRIIIICF